MDEQMRLLALNLFFLLMAARASHADDAAQSLLTKHCLTCHSGAKPKGDFDQAKLPRDFTSQGEHWQGVLDRLHPHISFVRRNAAAGRGLAGLSTPRHLR